MCGFSGFTNPNSKNEDEVLLKKMMLPIKHRGPDESSIYINDKIALGHYRLSIIDIKGGKQPCIDNENYLLFNGEIYGYKEIAKILRKKNIPLRNNSDTEVLFKSLVHFGVEKTLKIIEGMFAFAFYEGQSNTLWLVRDPLGEKPLYYIHNKTKTYFSSEVSGLSQINKKINKNAIMQYLHLDYIPFDQTLISEINKVLPGECIRINDSKITKKIYFNLNQENKNNISMNESLEIIDQLLEKSVKERLVADVPVGVFLSGGIDSSLISYYAKNINPNITSYTIKMENDTYDESKYAELVAKTLGIKNNITEFNNSEILQSLDFIENKMDEPLGDPSILPTYLLSKFAKESVKVVLSGDGADELFCGYAPFKGINYLNLLNFIPKSMGHILTSLMEKIPSQDNYMSYHFLLKHISRGFGYPPNQQVFRWMSPFSNNDIQKLLKRDYTEEYLHNNSWTKIIDKSKDPEIINDLSKIFLQHYLPNDILTKVDRASMYNGLEVRSPFLSKDIIDFSLKLPNKYKVSNGRTKLLLRRLSEKKLPNIISKRKKHGFAIPLAKMMRGSLKEKIEDTLLSKNNSLDGIFNRTNIEKTLKEHWNGIDNRKPIWAMYILHKVSERLI
jgi:asparagine synthase (glutamine-hydrolysing)